MDSCLTSGKESVIKTLFKVTVACKIVPLLGQCKGLLLQGET
jgi:hypothetical protein